jgi:hypothetical protein
MLFFYPYYIFALLLQRFYHVSSFFISLLYNNFLYIHFFKHLLCVQPQIFKKIRSELTLMWNRMGKAKNLRRSSFRSELLTSMKDSQMTSVHDLYNSCNQERPNMKVGFL